MNWDAECSMQRSMFASPKTWSMFDYDIASSAFQKCVRRSIWPDAFQWALEMFYTGTFGKKNTWNRVLNASVEDIGISDPALFRFIYEKLYNGDEIHLGVAVYLLCTSKKCRLNDWLVSVSNYSVYEKKKYYVNPAELVELRNKLFCCDRISSILILDKIYFSDKKMSPAKDIFKLFRNMRPDATELVDICETIEKESTWRYNAKTRLLFAHIINILYHNVLDKSMYNIDEYISRYITHVEEFKKIITDVKERKHKLDVKDFYLDKHTKRGRSMGRGIEHFIYEGGILIPEDDRYSRDSKEFEEMVKQIRGVS